MIDLRAEARELLPEHASRTEDGLWCFFGSDLLRPEEDALAVIESCLILDVPISEVLGIGTWLKLLKRVVALEERLR